MPVFEFECAVGHVSQDIFPAGEAPAHVVCPACLTELGLSHDPCGALQARRIVSRCSHVWAEGHHIDNDMAREQREFLKSDEGKKLLREDKLIPVSEMRPEYSDAHRRQAQRDKEFDATLGELARMKQAGLSPETARAKVNDGRKAKGKKPLPGKAVAA